QDGRSRLVADTGGGAAWGHAQGAGGNIVWWRWAAASKAPARALSPRGRDTQAWRLCRLAEVERGLRRSGSELRSEPLSLPSPAGGEGDTPGQLTPPDRRVERAREVDPRQLAVGIVG